MHINWQNLKADRVIELLYIGFIKNKAWKIGWTRVLNRSLYKNEFQLTKLQRLYFIILILNQFKYPVKIFASYLWNIDPNRAWAITGKNKVNWRFVFLRTFAFAFDETDGCKEN